MNKKSEEELEKERLKNLILYKFYGTDEEMEEAAPVLGVIIIVVLIIFFIAVTIF